VSVFFAFAAGFFAAVFVVAVFVVAVFVATVFVAAVFVAAVFVAAVFVSSGFVSFSVFFTAVLAVLLAAVLAEVVLVVFFAVAASFSAGTADVLTTSLAGGFIEVLPDFLLRRTPYEPFIIFPLFDFLSPLPMIYLSLEFKLKNTELKSSKIWMSQG
jgi:hypothetical protein